MLENPAIIIGSPGSQRQAPELKSIISLNDPRDNVKKRIKVRGIQRYSDIIGCYEEYDLKIPNTLKIIKSQRKMIK